MKKTKKGSYMVVEVSKAVVTHDNAIIYILLTAFILRFILLCTYSNNMYLFSDDVGYCNSAIYFIKSGYITYVNKNYLTLSGMPGMFLFMGGLFKAFGYTETGLFLTRFFFVILSVLTVYGVYLCGNIIFKNKAISNIAAALLAIAAGHISLSNIFLTETPSIFIFVYMTYFILRFCDDRSDKNFVFMLAFYLLGLIFKPVFGVYILGFLPLMLFKKMKFKEMFIRGGIAAVALCIFLSPWWVRNYKLVGEFIPLSGGQGDTLFLGTFQGFGYPEGNKEEIYRSFDVEASEMKTKYGYWNPYIVSKLKGIEGKKRINEWIQKDPKGFVFSSIVYKPFLALSKEYYPVEIFNIEYRHIEWIYKLQWAAFFIGLFYAVKNIKKEKELFFKLICVLIGGFIVVFVGAFYFSITRYAVTFSVALKLTGAFGIYNFISYICSAARRYK
ncbi:MAG: glycosyltransferase family 39 protein [Firmicutes bacterium]|nr:glycosyltransferase family 39 protein [Bacillota bacterium]